MSPLFALGLAIARNAATRRPPGSRLPTGPERYGIGARDPRCRERIAGILGSFFTGFEAELRAGTRKRLLEYREALYRPFFHEGRAMGIAARLSLRPRGLDRFMEAAIEGEEDPFLFLKYVGLGFWLGFRHKRRAARVEAIARRFGKYGDLVLDGYGFKLGFFDLPRDARAGARVLEAAGAAGGLSAGGAAALANGLGRSRWFFAMDDPPAAFREARGYGDLAPSVLGGLGLAAAITFPDDLARAYAAAGGLAAGERAHFEKGIRIALYARDVNDPDFLESSIAGTPEPIRSRAREDLRAARRAGDETRARPDFIGAFHRACLEPAG
jgi:hypothetical protein